MKIESVRDMFGDSIDVSERPGDILVSAHTRRGTRPRDYIFTPAQARYLARILLDAASRAEVNTDELEVPREN